MYLNKADNHENHTVSELLNEIDRLSSELKTSKLKISELEAAILQDPLVGVHNRRGFQQELDRAISFVQRYHINVCVVILDIDLFKAVNDRYGHHVGDKVLAEVARKLKKHTRRSDVVGRIGGDEFALVLWNLDQEKADQKCQQLGGLFEKDPFIHDGHSIRIGISAGATQIGYDGDIAENVMQRADEAMYLAKRDKANDDIKTHVN